MGGETRWAAGETRPHAENSNEMKLKAALAHISLAIRSPPTYGGGSRGGEQASVQVVFWWGPFHLTGPL